MRRVMILLLSVAIAPRWVAGWQLPVAGISAASTGSGQRATENDLDRLRHLLANYDYEAITREPMPTTAEGRAIRVWALYSSLAAKRGEAEAAAMERDLPDDPWTAAVRAHVLLQKLGRSADALAATEKMLAAAPQPLPERMVRVRVTALENAARQDDAGALLEKMPRTPFFIVERANHLVSESYRRK